jgi:hypothetical protein
VSEAFDELIDGRGVLQAGGTRAHQWLSVGVVCPALMGADGVSRS